MKLTIVKVDNVEIARVSSIKFLGVVIDQNTDWTKYTEFFVNKI